MNKRIDITKFDLKHNSQDIFRLEDEIKDNSYYNQTWFWCSDCNRKHRIGLSPFGHPIKPIPIKCEVDGDHCWKSIDKKKKFGMIMFEGIKNDVGILLTESHVVKCIICDKKGLKELTFITDYNIDITDGQLKELNKYVQSIRDLGFKKINEMINDKYKGMETIRILEFDKKIREIQNIQNYIIV